MNCVHEHSSPVKMVHPWGRGGSTGGPRVGREANEAVLVPHSAHGEHDLVVGVAGGELVQVYTRTPSLY